MEDAKLGDEEERPEDEKEADNMKIHNKLVRDKIPEIIKEAGHEPSWRILSDEEYRKALDQKLEEELKEYQESGAIEELADIVEVIEAIIATKGVSLSEFRKIKDLKAARRGGFKKKIFLIGVKTK